MGDLKTPKRHFEINWPLVILSKKENLVKLKLVGRARFLQRKHRAQSLSFAHQKDFFQINWPLVILGKKENFVKLKLVGRARFLQRKHRAQSLSFASTAAAAAAKQLWHARYRPPAVLYYGDGGT